AARGIAETGFGQETGEGVAVHRFAVDPVDDQRIHSARTHQIGQRGGGGVPGGRVFGAGEQGPATALEVQHEFAVDEYDQRPRFAARTVAGPTGGLGPGEGGTVRVGRITGRQYQRRGGRAPVALEGAQSVHHIGGGELGAAERVHEVAAPAAAAVLEF